MPCSPLRSLAMVVVALALAWGCAGEADTSPEVRASEIQAARAEVEGPVTELATATTAFVDAVETLRVDPPREPGARLDAIEGVRDLLSDLEVALASGEDVELAGDSDDVSAARSAWERLVGAADGARGAGEEELDALERVAEIDQELIALTEGWDERGSRSQQITRFEELEAEAEELTDDIADEEDVADCLTTFERRRDAAATVAERTDELRVLIERYRGDEFDELRSEYRQDPFGVEAAMPELDAAEAACWRESSPLVAAAEDFGGALEELEEALNPPDL